MREISAACLVYKIIPQKSRIKQLFTIRLLFRMYWINASVTYLHWWPKKNTTEWVQYDFEKDTTISASQVY